MNVFELLGGLFIWAIVIDWLFNRRFSSALSAWFVRVWAEGGKDE